MIVYLGVEFCSSFLNSRVSGGLPLRSPSTARKVGLGRGELTHVRFKRPSDPARGLSATLAGGGRARHMASRSNLGAGGN